MSVDEMGQIPVVYILSSGRSGSTLLDLLLGAHPDIWTIGEAQMLPWELRREPGRCGCGSSVRECEFWTPIRPNIPIGVGEYPIEYFRGDGGREKVLRWSRLPEVMRGAVREGSHRAMREYGQVNARYFGAVWQAAEARSDRRIRWLVDASKDPYRLLWLRDSALFRLRVIHLIKDPRAFVYSMIANDLPVPARRAVRYAARWVVQNELFSRLCRVGFAAGQSLRLRYEELAGRPQEALAAIGEWLSLPFPANLHRRFRESENHALSGSRMRWQDSGVRLDERWQSGLPGGYARLITALTWPVARSYGYNRGVG